MPAAAAIVALAVSACSSSPSPRTPDATSTDDTDAWAIAPRKPKVPYARIASIVPSPTDPQDRRAHIEFINPTNQSCSVRSYVLAWGSWSKAKPLERFEIPPGELRQRHLLLHPNDGDLSSLTVENAKVKLEVVCGQ
jgi:hypothetical protein